MSCIKNNSIVNNIMFAPPYPSYSTNLGVCWIKEVCCLFVQYHTVAGPLILTSDDYLEPHPVIIVCHGNACDIGQMVDFSMELCASCKSHVIFAIPQALSACSALLLKPSTNLLYFRSKNGIFG